MTEAEKDEFIENLEEELTELRDNYADIVRERDSLQAQVDSLTARIEGARDDLEDVVRGLGS
ncbi:hypothetical protein F7R91_14400 [Streptomyces luteolifulvus]|uniref:Uncharacterized protein n=1 Tax=Streptomyces luteolifulvus TaxID=2615112 RepID=A0A6H9V3J4_9ACTN|nr:hypothetical protein [Streptomyces luteolifulvus]KAB1146767.1 hypothetical protein F7R91_14400 [Streptomyces luteolifulvus]